MQMEHRFVFLFVSMFCGVMWCECEISFQFERIFHSPQMDSFLLTTQFVHCLISSSWWWENSSHFGLQDEQGKTGQARPGNFDPSWNRPTQFQVRARLTWRAPHFDGSDRDGRCFSSRSRSIWSSTVLFQVSFVYSARIISVTATRRIRLCYDAAIIVWFVGSLVYRLRISGNAVLRCECVCGCGYQRLAWASKIAAKTKKKKKYWALFINPKANKNGKNFL